MNTINIIGAIFQKQVKDTLKNLEVLILFIIYPLVAFVMVTTIPEEMGQATFFISIFSAMHIIFTPIVTASSIIAEEKEKNTLRVLTMSNVKSYQYLTSIGGFVFLATLLTACLFILMGNYTAAEALKCIAFMAIGCITSTVLGLAIGSFSKNAAATNAIAVPIGLLFGFLPMMASFNKAIEKISKFTYGHQISTLLSSPETSLTWESVWIISANFLVFLFVFMMVFRRNYIEK